MKLELGKLDYHFIYKPLLIGGMSMEYYGLRKSGEDVDLVIHEEDHRILREKYPNHIQDLYGDMGICEFGFELWNQICTSRYDFLRERAVEEQNFLVISLEKALFLKALAMQIPKYHHDLELIVGLILKKAYGRG